MDFAGAHHSPIAQSRNEASNGTTNGTTDRVGIRATTRRTSPPPSSNAGRNPAPPSAAADLARAFKGARSDRVEEVLATLAALGQARVSEGKFAAVV